MASKPLSERHKDDGARSCLLGRRSTGLLGIVDGHLPSEKAKHRDGCNVMLPVKTSSRSPPGAGNGFPVISKSQGHLPATHRKN